MKYLCEFMLVIITAVPQFATDSHSVHLSMQEVRLCSFLLYRVGQKSKLLYRGRYFKGWTIVLALNILLFCERSRTLKFGNTNSISVVKYSMLHTFMTSCLRS